MDRRESTVPFELERVVRPNILRLSPYHSAREQVQEGILLDANENPFPRRKDGLLLNRYPDPHQRSLRDALAAATGVGTQNVLAGAGSDEVIDWIFKVFCEPGKDRISIAEPTYGMYRVTAEIFGVSVFEFPLDEQFQFRRERFLDEVPADVKVLFLCSPNNPTGNLLDRDEIVRLCREWLGIVVVDEAYFEFCRGRSLTSEVDDLGNLVVLRTLSKAFASAALRLGYAVGQPQVISFFLKVKAPYNLSALTMLEALQVLSEAPAIRGRLGEIVAERERLHSRLRKIFGVEEVFPSDANFLLFRVRKGASEVCSRLLEQGVVVRDRSSMRGLQGCIRVSVGLREENDRFLKLLEQIVGDRL